MNETLYIYLNAADQKFSFDSEDFTQFVQSHPEIELRILDSEAELIDCLDEVVWLDTWHFSREWYGLAPKLKGIFTPAAGREYVAEDPSLSVPVHYGTFHGAMMAESALALVLHFSANLHQYRDQQLDKVWRRLPAKLLSSQSALIVGYGHIGKQCGQLLANLGMRVWGHQRQPQTRNDGVVELISQNQLDEYLPQADHIISFLPGGPATHHFFSQERLGRLSSSAYIYNFGRGTTIDEHALVDALQNQKLAGAGLDVTEVEPLPELSALWQQPNVMLLPHASAYYEEYRHLHVTELTELAFSLMTTKSSQ